MRAATLYSTLLILLVAACLGAASAAACDGLAKAACLAPACVWCVSAAVAPACYSKADAARLPPGVFDCSKAGAAEGGAAQVHAQAQAQLGVS